MNARIVLCVLCLAHTSVISTPVEASLLETRTESILQSVTVLPGVTFHLVEGVLKIKFNSKELFGEVVEGRGEEDEEEDDEDNEDEETKDGQTEEGGEQTKLAHNGLKKIGTMIMMVPLFIQLISLPGAIASVKMSLLKSIAVAKLAIVIMIFNALKDKNSQEDVVVIHNSQHHEHYYNSYHTAHEDEDGWFGR